LRVPFEPQVYAKNADVLDAVTQGVADVAFTNASAERASRMLFTQPYLLIELGYLARAQLPVTSPGDVDRAGLRMGVTARSSSDAILSRSLVHAQVVRAESITEGVQMMASATIDMYATNKATLYEMADKLPGARVLEGNWGIERHALGIPLGRERGLPYLRAFVSDAVASGLVQAASTRAGLRGAQVADAAH
jgi:polar amino acid transport system substrate-binding protein